MNIKDESSIFMNIKYESSTYYIQVQNERKLNIYSHSSASCAHIFYNFMLATILCLKPYFF